MCLDYLNYLCRDSLSVRILITSSQSSLEVCLIGFSQQDGSIYFTLESGFVSAEILFDNEI